MSGYGTDAGEMGAVADAVRGISKDPRDQIKKIKDTDIGQPDFGQGQGKHSQSFTSLLDKLGDLAHAEQAAMRDYADRLSDSKGGYEFSEKANADTVKKAGGK